MKEIVEEVSEDHPRIIIVVRLFITCCLCF